MRLFQKDLFRLEMKRSFMGVLVWSLSVGLTMYLIVVLYPMVKDMYSLLPPEYAEFLASFGGIPENVVQYYATEGAMMLQLFGAIFAVLEGFNAINRDEKEKTLESIYTLPYPRSTFYFTKFIRVMANVVLFSVVNTVLSILGFVTISESFAFGEFLYFSLMNMVMLLMIASIGFGLVSVMKPNQKGMVSMLVPLPLYILFMISTLTNNEWIQKLKHITPFTFADPVAILKTAGDFEYISFLVYIGIVISLIALGFYRFKKRDIMV